MLKNRCLISLNFNLDVVDKAKQNWLSIANLVLKKDSKELKKCLKMMKFGLFQSYKHISNFQERQQIIMSDK